MFNTFKLGDEVTWTSQAQGWKKEKTGIIVAVIPANEIVSRIYPEIRQGSSAWGGGLSRNHESYVVKVESKLYYPRVKDLQHTSRLSKENKSEQAQPIKKFPDWMTN